MESQIKILAHDINNKLHLVTLLIDSIVKEFKKSNTENAMDLYSKVKTELTTLSGICKSTLFDEKPVVFSLHELIEETSTFCEQYKVNLEFVSLKRPEVEVLPIFFKRAMANIIKNSIEAGSTHIIIELRDSQVSISDNGGGIPKDQMSDIKSGKINSTKTEGSGLGLITVVEFCQKLNWILSIENYNYVHGFKKTGLRITMKFK